MFPQHTHDAFARGALGSTGERVWRLILTEPLRAAEIARQLQVNRSNVSRALVKLEARGLAFKDSSRRWAANSAGTNELNGIAAHYGTLGKAERRRERHARERGWDVSEAILRRKRQWERRSDERTIRRDATKATK